MLSSSFAEGELRIVVCTLSQGSGRYPLPVLYRALPSTSPGYRAIKPTETQKQMEGK